VSALLCASQCTLRYTSAVRHAKSSGKVFTHSADILVVDFTFFAKDRLAAKEWCLQKLNDAHLGGHAVCINSRRVYTLVIALQSFSRRCRADYIYTTCKLCHVKCCAAAVKGVAGRWRVSKLSNGVGDPCNGTSVATSVTPQCSIQCTATVGGNGQAEKIEGC
jgi:hypothetical protein